MKNLTDVQQEAWDAVQKHGGIRAAARALGKNYTTVHDSFNRAKAKIELDPGVADALEEVGIQDPSRVRGGWLKTKDAKLFIVFLLNMRILLCATATNNVVAVASRVNRRSHGYSPNSPPNAI